MKGTIKKESMEANEKNQIDIRPFKYAFDIIEGKWKMHILFWLWKNPVLRYGELKKSMGKVTDKMLSSQLKELEKDGIILRKEYPQIPPKVEYSLTPLGQSMMPILSALCKWGKEHMPNSCLQEKDT